MLPFYLVPTFKVLSYNTQGLQTIRSFQVLSAPMYTIIIFVRNQNNFFHKLSSPEFLLILFLFFSGTEMLLLIRIFVILLACLHYSVSLTFKLKSTSIYIEISETLKCGVDVLFEYPNLYSIDVFLSVSFL